MPKVNWTYLTTVIDEIEVNQKKKGFPPKVITSIKNSMSDRCATLKKLMIFFIKYRMKLLPQLLKIGTSFPKKTSSHWEMSK